VHSTKFAGNAVASLETGFRLVLFPRNASKIILHLSSECGLKFIDWQ